jgi:nucleoside-diphosphate kinase
MLNKSSMEETLIMIKPDAMLAKNAGAIITILEKSEFKLKKSKIFRMDDEFVKKFYAEHIGKEFFPGLKKFMQSGPIMAIVLERENAIKYLRKIIGSTDSSKAAPGTIRNLYGNHQVVSSNAVHASDCPKSAKREINLIFQTK